MTWIFIGELCSANSKIVGRPESLHMIGAKPEGGEAYSEGAAAAVYATSFTVGVAACILLEVFIHKRGGAAGGLGAAIGGAVVVGTPKAYEAGGDAGGAENLAIEDGGAACRAAAAGKQECAADAKPKPKAESLCDVAHIDPIAWQVIIGDFFHNLVDGIVVGAAAR